MTKAPGNKYKKEDHEAVKGMNKSDMNCCMFSLFSIKFANLQLRAKTTKIALMRPSKILWPFLRSPKGCQFLPPWSYDLILGEILSALFQAKVIPCAVRAKIGERLLSSDMDRLLSNCFPFNTSFESGLLPRRISLTISLWANVFPSMHRSVSLSW